MSINHRSLIVFLIVLSVSCSVDRSTELGVVSSKTIVIDKKDFLDKISESQVFDSVIFIPLNLPKNELMGSIADIQMYRNNYYVLDMGTQKIHEFNKNWEFEKTLFSLGAGPNEYNEILNFSFINNYIVINDLMKVEYYSLDDFAPVKTVRKNHMGFKTYVTNDEHILNYQLNSPMDDSPFNVTIYNYKNDDITYQGSLIKSNIKGFTFSQEDPFYTNKGDNYFIEAFNDTIYNVENGELSTHRIIDFQDIRLEIDDLIAEPGITSRDIANSDKAYFLGNYLNNELVETFSFSYKSKRFLYMANKQDSVHYIYSSMIQDRTVLQLPINYFLLDGQNIFSAKDIEQVSYELEVVKERIASNPQLQIHEATVNALESKLKNSSGVIVKIHVK